MTTLRSAGATILLCTTLFAPFSAAQVVEQWVAEYDGPASGDDWAFAIAVDDSGNVYVTGRSPGTGTQEDYATIKYSANGVEQWVARHNSANDGFDTAKDIAVDSAGNVYITGWSGGGATVNYDYGTIKYDSSGVEQWVALHPRGQAHALDLDSSGNVYVTGNSVNDWVTIKYSTDGLEQWLARYDSGTVDFARDVTLDGSGNVYVTGMVLGAGPPYLGNYGTIKYTNDGVEQWVATYDGPAADVDGARHIVVDGSGNVFVTGNSTGVGSGLDFATVKYGNDGVEQWVRRYDGPGNGDDWATGIAVDSAGNVYVTGSSNGGVTHWDYTTIKYAADGTEQWVRRYDGPAGGLDYAYDIGVDDAGNAYVTGQSDGVVAYNEFATIKYAPDGTEQWVVRHNAGSESAAQALALDGQANVYVTGYGNTLQMNYHTVKYANVVVPDPVHYTCYKGITPKRICAAGNEGASCKDDKDCTGVKGDGSCVLYEFTETGMVGLDDQFEVSSYDVVKAERLCTPTIKTPLNFLPDPPPGIQVDLDGVHLEGYKIEDSSLHCGDCSGGVNQLTIQYAGAGDVTFTVDGKVTFEGPYTMGTGGTITLDGNDKKGEMGSSIDLVDLSGNEIASFHTSCSRPIGIGTASEGGLFKVIGGSSIKGGPLGSCDDPYPSEIKEPWASCNDCEGGVSYAQFEYLGAESVVIVEDKHGNVLYNAGSSLVSGDTFVVLPLSGKDKLEKEVFLLQGVGDSDPVSIHTSCSKPFGPGLVVGDFLVVAAESVKGGQNTCPVIQVDNQFGRLYLQAKKTKYLLAPTAKSLDPTPNIDLLPSNVDHYKCYEVKFVGAEKGLLVRLKDQFHDRAFEVKKPKLLCNPVAKNHLGLTAIQNIEKHLTCYDIKAVKGVCGSKSVFANQVCDKDADCGTEIGLCEIQTKDRKIDGLYLDNQFGDERLDLDKVEELCVPSQKKVG